MNRNVLYLIIGALVVATAVFGYQLYQERQKTGIDIGIGDRGISIEKKYAAFARRCRRSYAIWKMPRAPEFPFYS